MLIIQVGLGFPLVRVKVSGSTFRSLWCTKTLEEYRQVSCGLDQWMFPVSQQHLALISFSWRQDISHSLPLLHGIWEANFLEGMLCYVGETTGRQRQEAFFTGGSFEDPELVFGGVMIWLKFVCDALLGPESRVPSETLLFLSSWIWTLHHCGSAVPSPDTFCSFLFLPPPSLPPIPLSQWNPSSTNSMKKPQS